MQQASIDLTIGFVKKTWLESEYVDAIFEFDPCRILQKIKIRRFTNKRGSLEFWRRKPVLDIDPLWPDKRIQDTLLRSSPIGTPWREMRVPDMHFAGAPINPFPWIGKSGKALVLAILPMGDCRYTDVRVIWVMDKNERLADIVVQRVDYDPKAAGTPHD